MRDFKIAKKLTAVFAIIIACFCIAVVATILGMNSVGNSYESFYENSHEAIVTFLQHPYSASDSH